MPMPTLNLVFERDKVTDSKVRFKQRAGDPEWVGPLYIDKTMASDATRLRVLIGEERDEREGSKEDR